MKSSTRAPGLAVYNYHKLNIMESCTSSYLPSARAPCRPHTALSYRAPRLDHCSPHLISGRRRLCLMFCVTYSLTCGLLLVPSLPVLLLGRVLGGISTSILFSAFESWLVSASSTAALHSEDLSAIMGRATLVNGFVAAAAGVRFLICRFAWCAHKCLWFSRNL